MYYPTQDLQLFEEFWREEVERMPRWWQDSTNALKTTWDDFQDFCSNMWKIWSVDDVALVYTEKIGNHANIHFSMKRGAKIDIQDLIGIRDELLKDFRLIFGWSATKNKGLCRILEDCGFKWDGLTMLYGESRGKVFEYKCYTYKRVVASPSSVVFCD